MKEYSLFDTLPEEPKKSSGPVTCLGMTFENDDERRAYFTEELRKKLQDPEFRKIEGFPIGKDEDILALSDPPYYTACPNPWIAEFISEWESSKFKVQSSKFKVEPGTLNYHREPFAADVSEGKNDPIYNAHSYHTKVPHKAIMRYILHYTEPGDIVFDGFCGTGMTGVAAQLCGDKNAVTALGYKVNPDGTILQEEINPDGKKDWRPFSKLGARKAVLNDLSPAATFIAYNYNTPVDVEAFEREAKRILKEVEEECGWMYETKHSDGRTGKINYTVWSDVFVCPECAGEVVFWDVAVDFDNGKVRDSFPCPLCNATLSKRNMERSFYSRFDHALQKTIRQGKQVPVLINYTLAGKRVEKKPDLADLNLAQRVQATKIPYRIPSERLMEGQETRRNDPIGITHVHHFYTDRNLYVFASFFDKAPRWLKWAVTGSIQRGSKQHQIAITRIGGSKAKEGGATAGHRRGTLYVPSNQIEMNAITLISDRVKVINKALFAKKTDGTVISTGSTTARNIQSGAYDYFFFDPPFGANIAYSELNSLQESWLGLSTNQEYEAIEDKSQHKSLIDYHSLMKHCFDSAYIALKPGRWMTVEFSNTSAGVWNVIQSALQEAGFIVANVSSLDKKRGGLNAIVGTTAVKQDLAISAYKPNGGFEERFQKEAQTEEGVWDFVRTHLKYLPVTKPHGDQLQFVPERDPRILFDQMVAFYVRKGYLVPLSSQEFQAGLAQRFSERDGMYFLPEQVAEYDRRKMNNPERRFQAAFSGFVDGEATAIDWLRYQLKEKPQTFQEINPNFMMAIGGWSKNETPLDLRELLNQNYLCYDGKGAIPAQIVSWLRRSSEFRPVIEAELKAQGIEPSENLKLETSTPQLLREAEDRWYVPDPNQAGDLERLREKALLKEFDAYKEAKTKLKVFRLEAVRAGFKKAWQERDYAIIVKVAEKIPNSIMEEDPKLLMWYDQAITRIGGE